jgi:hypothetical protein
VNAKQDLSATDSSHETESQTPEDADRAYFPPLPPGAPAIIEGVALKDLTTQEAWGTNSAATQREFTYRFFAKLMMDTALKQRTTNALGTLPDAEKLRLKLFLSDLAKLITEATAISQNYAVKAVRNHLLSRVEVADILGVHQGTVAKWVKTAEQEKAKWEKTAEQEKDID